MLQEHSCLVVRGDGVSNVGELQMLFRYQLMSSCTSVYHYSSPAFSCPVLSSPTLTSVCRCVVAWVYLCRVVCWGIQQAHTTTTYNNRIQQPHTRTDVEQLPSSARHGNGGASASWSPRSQLLSASACHARSWGPPRALAIGLVLRVLTKDKSFLSVSVSPESIEGKEGWRDTRRWWQGGCGGARHNVCEGVVELNTKLPTGNFFSVSVCVCACM